MGGARFEFYDDGAGEHRWRLKAANGEVVAVGEGHGSEADARRAAFGVAGIAAEALDRQVGLAERRIEGDELREAEHAPPPEDREAWRAAVMEKAEAIAKDVSERTGRATAPAEPIACPSGGAVVQCEVGDGVLDPIRDDYRLTPGGGPPGPSLTIVEPLREESQES